VGAVVAIETAAHLFLRGLSLFRATRNQHRVGPRGACNLGGLQLLLGVRSLVWHYAVIEEIAKRSLLNCEADIFRNITGSTGKLQGIQLFGYNADHKPAGIEQRPAAVSRLYRRTDLKEARIIQKSAERIHNARRDRKIRGQKTMIGIADRYHPVAGTYGAVSDRRRLIERAVSLQQRQIVELVRRHDTK
jgi:hypothetical protein